MVKGAIKGKVQQVIWVDLSAMVSIMALAKQFNLAPNVIISELLNLVANNEEIIKQLEKKLQPEMPKGIFFQCNICFKSFPSQNDLIKHLYTHAQPKQ